MHSSIYSFKVFDKPEVLTVNVYAINNAATINYIETQEKSMGKCVCPIALLCHQLIINYVFQINTYIQICQFTEVTNHL